MSNTTITFMEALTKLTGLQHSTIDVILGVLLALSIILHFVDFRYFLYAAYLRYTCKAPPAPSSASNKKNTMMASFKNELRRRFLCAEPFVRQCVVSTNDLDFLGHMNNARYFRETDFGRFEAALSTGLWQACSKVKTPMVVGSQTIRYRRELRLGTKYEVRTAIVGYDEKSLFFETRFISCDNKKKEEDVHAIVLVRLAVAVSKKVREREPPTSIKVRAPMQYLIHEVFLKAYFPDHHYRGDVDAEGNDDDTVVLPRVWDPPQDVMDWAASTNATYVRVLPNSSTATNAAPDSPLSMSSQRRKKDQ